MSEPALDRAHLHVNRFNHAVTSGDWEGFVAHFSPDAQMTFSDELVPPLQGHQDLLDAYLADPPGDTLHVVGAEEHDGVDVVRFAWTSGGAGTLLLTWAGDRVASMEIAQDPG